MTRKLTDIEARARWNAIYLEGKTWVEDCGCKTSETTWQLCPEHWREIDAIDSAPDDPDRVARMAAAFRSALADES